ncbi:hypothetical protein BB559_006185 [Furculomyces boomerangus]|uniref:DH domain-containing protein n=1 Tax=Furculomyces boomerangus TaxID=61424 RepID=A0A2T9Y4A7_9FUNG|nr:hypothetical protein BB559_006185 [Furculomyces boomerangus]
MSNAITAQEHKKRTIGILKAKNLSLNVRHKNMGTNTDQDVSVPLKTVTENNTVQDNPKFVLKSIPARKKSSLVRSSTSNSADFYKQTSIQNRLNHDKPQNSWLSINKSKTNTSKAKLEPQKGMRPVVMHTQHKGPFKATWRSVVSERELELLNLSEAEMKIQEIIFEIILTEKEYLRDIEIIRNVFEIPLRQSNIIAKKQINEIFMNIGSIHDLHKMLCEELSKRQKEQHPVIENLADLFMKRVPQFSIYRQYICGQSNSIDLVKNLKNTNVEFSEFCKKKQSEPESRGLPIESFLLIPFQRLLKYPLLVKSGIKALDSETNPEYLASMNMLFESFEEQISKIQTAKENSDNLTWLKNIQPHFKDLTIKLHRYKRRLLVVGHASMKTTIGQLDMNENNKILKHQEILKLSAPKDVTVWLFNDLLLITKCSNVFIKNELKTKKKLKLANDYESLFINHPDDKSKIYFPDKEKLKLLLPPAIISLCEVSETKETKLIKLKLIPVRGKFEPGNDIIYLDFELKGNYNEWRSRIQAHMKIVEGRKDTSYSSDESTVGIAKFFENDEDEKELSNDEWTFVKGFKYISSKAEKFPGGSMFTKKTKPEKDKNIKKDKLYQNTLLPPQLAPKDTSELPIYMEDRLPPMNRLSGSSSDPGHHADKKLGNQEQFHKRSAGTNLEVLSANNEKTSNINNNRYLCFVQPKTNNNKSELVPENSREYYSADAEKKSMLERNHMIKIPKIEKSIVEPPTAIYVNSESESFDTSENESEDESINNDFPIDTNKLYRYKLNNEAPTIVLDDVESNPSGYDYQYIDYTSDESRELEEEDKKPSFEISEPEGSEGNGLNFAGGIYRRSSSLPTIETLNGGENGSEEFISIKVGNKAIEKSKSDFEFDTSYNLNSDESIPKIQKKSSVRKKFGIDLVTSVLSPSAIQNQFQLAKGSVSSQFSSMSRDRTESKDQINKNHKGSPPKLKLTINNELGCDYDSNTENERENSVDFSPLQMGKNIKDFMMSVVPKSPIPRNISFPRIQIKNPSDTYIGRSPSTGYHKE